MRSSTRSRRGWRRSALISAPTRGRAEGRSSASTGTRASKDKSPYKTNVGINFRHEQAKDAHAPGYYLHIGPGEVYAGGGIWHPATEAATRIREAIVAEPARWKRATRGGAFAKRFELGGDSLKRVPPWADTEHPFADDLKRKSFYAWARLNESDVVAPGFIDEYARICRDTAPLQRFLCDALECSSSASPLAPSRAARGTSAALASRRTSR